MAASKTTEAEKKVPSNTNDKIVVGLTGGIGSGKSAATSQFAALGIDIIDADEVARDVVIPGSEGLVKITEHFGSDILLEDGTLNRAALRERVFNSSEEKQWLNQLLHPLIRKTMLQQIADATSHYCILSVPLLVEGNLTELCDRVIVVDCPESMQLERAMQRDGSTKQIIESIMASQATRKERLAAADDVIDNSKTLDFLNEQVLTLHSKYTGE
ncbi:dephospho-CoA kinase [Alteromonas sp. CI.11.F.A3]|uniref:dephospho-CoA kinase n=1 Tax=Alteromonas sp. CI.11.F.A3 TaxID=3079555 RepID=UPI002942C67C|nr:dephospho-CoA kinase [Alteromonas sp. CI.11.F.A3]WOI38492.1 dephospho-CoA kinase [Alteromonas sp. CI.11.F.A3]